MCGNRVQASKSFPASIAGVIKDGSDGSEGRARAGTAKDQGYGAICILVSINE